jgi:putative MATE family efflux protein
MGKETGNKLQNQMKNQDSNLLGSQPVGKLLAKYAVPSVVSMVVMALYNIVDQIFIAKGVGYIGNGATTAAFPLVTVSLALALLIGNGAAAFISLELGRGHADKAQRTLGNAVLLLSCSGLLLTTVVFLFMEPLLRMLGATEAIMPHAVDYVTYIAMGFPFVIVSTGIANIIRADGSPRYSMVVNLAGALLNTVLDPIFIFALNMGVKGAAIATAISQVVSFSLSILYILKQAHYVQFSLPNLRPDISIIRKVVSLGSASFITQISITIVNVVLNNSLTYYGAQSPYGAEIALSGLGIVMKINSIFINVILGIAVGAQPLLGYNYGAGYYDRVRSIYKTEVAATFFMSMLANLLFVLRPDIPVAIFRDQNPVFNEFAAMATRTFLCCVFSAGIQIPSANYFQAVGKPMISMVLNMSRQLLILVPCILILPHFFGLKGILYAMPVTDILAMLLALAFIFRELHHLRHPEEALLPQAGEPNAIG